MSNDLILTDAEGTPAGYGDTVQYILDKLGEGQLGPELLTNGGFDDTTGWTLTGAWGISGGTLNSSAPGEVVGNCAFSGIVPARVGVWIKVTFTIASQDLRGHYFSFGSEGPWQNLPAGAGTFTRFYQVTGLDGTFYVRKGDPSATIALDNISVREIKGIHAIQASASLKPVLGRMPVGGRRNLLTASEAFDTAAWSKTNLTVATSSLVAPDNTSLVQKLVSDVITGGAVLTRSYSSLRGTTLSLYVKSAGVRYVFIRNPGYATVVYYDLEAGTVNKPYTDSAVSGEIFDEGDGWFRLVYRYDLTAASDITFGFDDDGAGASQSYTGDGTSGVYLTGFQYELGNTPTPYQRVTNGNDVYEEGQQHIEYLRFDHTDDKIAQTFPDGFNGDLVVCGTEGSWIDKDVTVAAGSDLVIGPKHLPNTTHILPILGDIIGWVPVGKSLTEEEWRRVVDYYKGRGAKGLLVPSGINSSNASTFNDAGSWTSYGSNTIENYEGAIRITYVDNASGGYIYAPATLVVGKRYRFTAEVRKNQSGTAAARLTSYSNGTISPVFNDATAFSIPVGEFGVIEGEFTYIAGYSPNGRAILGTQNMTTGDVVDLRNIRFEELIPEEELA